VSQEQIDALDHPQEPADRKPQVWRRMFEEEHATALVLTAELATTRQERDARWKLEQILGMLDYVTSHQMFDQFNGHDTVRELGNLFRAHNPDGTLAEIERMKGDG
jgi:hypothetical protein